MENQLVVSNIAKKLSTPIYFFLFIFLLLSCDRQTTIQNIKKSGNSFDTIKSEHKPLKKIKQVPCEEDNYKPDIEVNNVILGDQESVINKFGTLRDKIIEKEELPHVSFLNKDKTQKLKMVLFPGSGQNDVYQFCVEYVQKNSNGKILVLDDNEFYTESGIKLGIMEEELIRIKGTPYRNNNDEIEYRILNYETSCFLRKYNLPEYFAIYTFKNNKLIKFHFGFTYP